MLSSKLVHTCSFNFSRYFLIFRSWDYRNSNTTSNRSHQYAMLFFVAIFFRLDFHLFSCGVDIWEIKNGGHWTVGCMYKHPYLAWKAWYLEYTENFYPDISLAWMKNLTENIGQTESDNCYVKTGDQKRSQFTFLFSI